MGKTSAVPLLARRFLLSKESDQFLSLISWVSVVGVALGVVALVVVTSVINGFEGELSRVISGMNGDVVLYTRAEPVSHPEEIIAKVHKILPEIQAITPGFVTELMVAGPNGVGGAVLEGVDADTISKVTVIPEKIITGRMPVKDGEFTVGSALASKLGLKEGSELKLITPSIGQEGGAPKAMSGTVVGVVKLGMYDYDSKFIFGTLHSVQSFFDQPEKVTSFKIRLKNSNESHEAALRLSDAFGYPFRAKEWAQFNRNLFYAIQLEKAVISIILTVIVLVAAFNVVSTLMMMVHDKTREIAILKVMGFRPSQSFGLFCLIGMGIGIVGTLGGVILGMGLNWVIEHSHLIDLPPEIYYIGFLPVVVKWKEIVFISCISLFITFLATLYPAIKVSTRSPLEGLRYD